jgi:cytochrome c peroxidase
VRETGRNTPTIVGSAYQSWFYWDGRRDVRGRRGDGREPQRTLLRPLFSNGGFHNVATGSFEGERLDFGRALGLRAVLLDEFNCLGPFSDAKPEECRELRFLNRDAHIPLDGAFRTPTLRNLAATAPYGHDGRFADLGQVLRHYNAPPSVEQAGPHELAPLGLAEHELEQLRAFLLALGESESR